MMLMQNEEDIKKLLLSEGRASGGLSGFELYPTLKKLFFDVEMPLIPVLAKMTNRGILLDIEKLKRVGVKIDAELEISQKNLLKETGDKINLNSPTQLGKFLVEILKVPLPKTKTGKYATNEKVLVQFSDEVLFLKKLIEYRGLAKLKSTYVESLMEKIDAQSRVHTNYIQIGANTGRIASSNPNLQNIPTSSSLGMEIKSCFIASPGYSLVSFDYCQQELRILAHLTAEPGLIQAFLQNLDVHTQTASKLFSVEYSMVTSEQRKIAKTINFGIIYGMGTYGLSSSLHISPAEAEGFINEFYASYPAIKTFYESYLNKAITNGYVETILGRRYFVEEDVSKKYISNATRRMLMNYPIQGSAADLMKLAMVNIEQKVLQKYSNVHLILQIHDELVFEIPDSDLDNNHEIVDLIKSTLCSVWPLKVPLTVDTKTGKNWGEI